MKFPSLGSRSAQQSSTMPTGEAANTGLPVPTPLPAVMSDKDEQLSDESAAERGVADPDYPKGIKLAIIVVALCFSVFLVALDNTIIATAIPRITDHFKALDDVGWYGSAYLLTACSCQFVFAKFYTFFSIKLVYLTALFIFEVGSIICASAPTSVALIVGRAVAGLGVAGIFSGALIIVAHSAPLHRRPMMTGFIGSMYGIASIVGPLVGGALVDNASWRDCFWINLPIGGVTFIIITLLFKPPHRKVDASIGFTERLKRFDPIGTVLFIPGTVCLLLALQWGGSRYPWHDGRIITLFVVFAVLILAFAAVQVWRQDNATLPLRVLSQRSVAAAIWFAFCTGGGYFLMIYWIPIWFQAIKGTSAIGSGIHVLPMILGVSSCAIIAGICVSKFGYYTPFMLFSTVVMSVGAGLLTTLTPSSGHAEWIGYQALFGIGVGSGLQQGIIAVQTVLPLQDVPIGTSLVVFGQMFGGALMISVAQNVFTTHLVANLYAAVPGVNLQIVVNTGATSLKSAVDPKYLTRVLLAYNKALTTTYVITASLAALTIFGSATMEWRSVRDKKKQEDLKVSEA